MALLWNYESGKLENVSENDVTPGVASGRLAFRKGVRIPVVGPEGEKGTIDAADAGTAFQTGWRFHTATEVAAETRAGIEAAKAEAYDRPGTAFAAGALRGATVGLSDVALRGLGADEEALGQIRERSPIASVAGEITGGIAAMATPLSPVSVLAKGGAAVAKATTGAIGATSKAGQIVASMTGAGVGSAVEGAAYGAGVLLTEEALGDPNLTVSQMASTVGWSTLLGAGLGVVGKGASAVWNKWKSSASNPVALMSEGYGKVAAKTFGLTGSAEKEFVEVFERGNAAQRAEIAHNMTNPDELYARGLAAVNALEQAGKAGAKATGEVRQGMVQGATDVYTPKQTEAVNDIVEKMSSAIKEISGSEVYEKSVAAKIAQTSEDFLAKLNGAETQADVFSAVHGARAELDQFTKNLRGDRGIKSQSTLGIVSDVRDAIQSHLRDKEVYGAMSGGFEEADAVFTKYLAARDNFKDQFMASKFVAGKGKVKEVSPGKVKGFFQKPEAESMAFKKETISELESSVGEMQEYAAKNGYNFGVDIGKISDEIANIKRLRVSELALSHAESFTGKALTGGIAGLALGGVGSMVSDDIGAGTTATLGLAGFALANPRMAVKYLAKMERLQNEFGARADGALTSLLSIPRKGVLPTVEAGGVARRTALMELAQQLAPDDNQPKDHSHALDALAPYINDSSMLDDRLVQANPHLDGVAPNTYAAMVNQSHAALKFMQEKWPQKGNADAIFSTPGSLTASEKHSLEAYAVGAFSPGVVLSQLKTGNVDPKAIEAVRVVHPELFEDLKRRLIEKIPEAKNISYQKKLTLGTAFGIPTTAGMANVGLIQQSLNMHEQQQPQQSSAADFQRFAQSQQTPTMQIASR